MTKILFSHILFIAILIVLTGCGKVQDKPTYAILKINSNPNDAIISVRDKNIGVTPYNQKVQPATLIVKISKTNYYPAWERIDLQQGKETSINIDLQPVKSSVLLISRPANAKVIINGDIKGATPLILRDLAIGSYTAKIEKPGFTTREAIWEVKDEQPQEVIVSLNSNVGRIELDSKPEHSQVYINGKLAGYAPFKRELEEGKYQFKFEKDGYATVEETITIIRDQNVEKSIKLNQLPGSIEVTSIPDGADVFINDQPHGVTPLQLNSIQSGKYTIRLEKNSYDQVFKDIVITPGKKSLLEFNLSKNTGGIDLVVNPPGTTIYVNGKSYGVTEKGENRMLSRIFQVRGINAGKYEITAAHKRAVPDSITVAVTVQKGQVARPKPLTLWVANAELKLKNGKASIGLLYAENNEKIFFGPEPGVKVEYDKSEIEYIKPIESGDE
jgi:hypothetical protein